jgi:hypothetical protein
MRLFSDTCRRLVFLEGSGFGAYFPTVIWSILPSSYMELKLINLSSDRY